MYTTTKIEHCIFDRVEVDVEKRVRLIINSKDKREKYDNFTSLTQKINDGQVILLLNEKINYSDINPNIIFKQVNIRKNDFHCNVRYGKFDYVKDFMDNVIRYRINNNRKDIDKSQLYELLRLFVIDKKDIIEKKYQQTFNQQQEALKKQLEENTIQYPKELQKILTLPPH